MKKLNITLGLIAFCLTIGKTQNVSYSYSPINKSEVDTPTYNFTVLKIFAFKEKYRAKAIRFLNNSRYEEIYYTKKTVENMRGGFYAQDKNNVIYMDTKKVPKWYSLKKYILYKFESDGLYLADKKGNVGNYSPYKYIADERAYAGWNFNILSNNYYYGKTRRYWGLSTYGKDHGGYGLYDLIEQRFIELSKIYLPEYSSLLTTSYAPIQDYKKEVNNNFEQIKNDTSTLGLLKLFATVVHESVHQKQSELSDESTYGYYLANQKEIKVPKISGLFNSEELFEKSTDSMVYFMDEANFARILSYLRDYVNSNTQGIFGILDEFSAYSHSANVSINLIQKLTDSIYSPVLSEEINSLSEIPNNYFCFNYMIAWYLDYAKKYHPDTYQEMVNNKKLREAYTAINTFYEQQLARYQTFETTGIVATNYKQATGYKGLLNAYASKKTLLDEFKTQ